MRNQYDENARLWRMHDYAMRHGRQNSKWLRWRSSDNTGPIIRVHAVEKFIETVLRVHAEPHIGPTDMGRCSVFVDGEYIGETAAPEAGRMNHA